MGFGCMNASGNFTGPAPDKNKGIGVIRAAHQKGVTFFDTAEFYGPYTNEELRRRGARACSGDRVAIATKFGFLTIEKGGLILNSRPEGTSEEWLRDLSQAPQNRPHRICIYQHRVDPNVPIEDVQRAR